MEKTPIIEKIKKLLALAHSCNEHEAALAAGFVQGAAPATCHAGVSEALDAAFAAVVPGDRLLVCGSFHAVGPALDWFDEHPEGA